MNKKIAIIDYGMGNIFSVKQAIYSIGYNAKITSNPKEIINADKIILPGVEAFPKAMKQININGLQEAINIFLKKGNYLLGICLGMQILFDRSYEFGEYIGLGLIEGTVEKFPDSIIKSGKKIPQISWNNILINKGNYNSKGIDNRLFNDIKNESDFYFAHSYCCKPHSY